MDDYLESVLQGWIANVGNLIISFIDWMNTHPALTLFILIAFFVLAYLFMRFSFWYIGREHRFYDWLRFHRDDRELEGEE